MRQVNKKEYKAIQEVFKVSYTKILFKHLYEEELITRNEYLSLIKNCDEMIDKILEKGGLKWKKEK